MEDEILRKEKYLCAYDGIGGVTIGDLFFKAANPIYNRVVKLKQGEYILTELLDFADLKKSRTTGALSKFIEMGWIVVENPDVQAVVAKSASMEIQQPSAVHAITELSAGLIRPKDITNYAATAAQPKVASSPFPEDRQPKVVESLSLDKSRTINSLAISETQASQAVQDVSNAYEHFNSLKYFQKLKAIKDTTNIPLLEMISTKSQYPQLIHNSKNRIRELQK